MSDFNWPQFWVVAIIALLLGGIAVYILFPKGEDGLSQAEINDLIANATASKDATIASLNSQLAAKSNQTISGGTTNGGTVTVIKETGGYLIDDFFLETPKSKDLSDREISLFDGEVDFDGKSYDADETFSITNITLKANENDFEGNVYLTLPENSLSYKIAFESGLNISKIGVDDKTLTFDFLGKEVEVLEWGSDSITLLSGKDYLLIEGQSVTVEGKNVTLVYVTEDYAYVSVSGVGSKINEKQTKSINGLEVRASDILYRSNAESKAELKIAKKVQTIIDDGDEYEQDGSWTWIIDDSLRVIGLTLNEEYTNLDEEFSALAPKDEICLPNRYVCVEYNGLSDVDREEYTFDVENTNYIIAKGDFVSGVNDYSRIYINRNNETILDKLTNGVVLSNIKLGNTDSILVTNLTDITINDFMVSKNLNLTNIGSHDYNWMTNYGIFVKNSKNALDNSFFTITVPEEKVSGSITVKDINFKDTATAITNSTGST